jgi:hypothetical protein
MKRDKIMVELTKSSDSDAWEEYLKIRIPAEERRQKSLENARIEYEELCAMIWRKFNLLNDEAKAIYDRDLLKKIRRTPEI